MCSEQQVVDCSSAYGNNACNGGWPVNVWKYVTANKGLDKTVSYPYTSGTSGQVSTISLYHIKISIY